ncbi:MAG TPA: acyltransferase [Tepidiformaceae bacterium]|nr:acyltransferase [Tepidiformaceae bacterium]
MPLLVGPKTGLEPGGGPVSRLDSLTGLRFFAAWLVLQHHFTNFALVPVLQRYTGFGATGVTFFFVLSGFVLTWSFVPSDTAPRFYWRRFARIWPLHALTTLLALPVFYTWRDVPLEWGPVLLSFALLHAWVPTATTYFAGNPASWSLSCEMFFYAVHPLLIRRVLGWSVVVIGGAMLAVGVATVVVADLAIDWPDRIAGWLLYISPVFRIGEFFLGMALAAALKRGLRIPLPLLPAALLTGLWFVFYYDVAHRMPAPWPVWVANANYVVLPVLYGLVITAAAQLDLAGAPSFLRDRAMVRLGEWSYALYLIHATVIYALIKLIGARSSVQYTNVVWLVGVSVVCIVVSAALYRFFEYPVEAWLRAFQKRRVAAAPVVAAD